MSVDPWVPPAKQGLYDPDNEHEACGVGFIVAIDGTRSNKVRSLINIWVLCNVSTNFPIHLKYLLKTILQSFFFLVAGRRKKIIKRK